MSPIVVMSTSESEVICVCACVQKVQFSRKLDAELGFRTYENIKNQKGPSIGKNTVSKENSDFLGEETHWKSEKHKLC